MNYTSKRKTIWIVALAVLFTLVFCTGFVFFYSRRVRQSTSSGPVGSGKPLPSYNLIDQSHQQVPDSQLRTGKIIVVFVEPDCDACLKESQFLQEAIAKRPDVSFYGIVSFGDRDTALRQAEKEFPFKVFYDQNFQLAGQLGIKRVPIKLFVENGIIKKSWGGATVQPEKQTEFLTWLERL